MNRATTLLLDFSTPVYIFGRTQKMLLTILKKILPWVVAGLIFAWLFNKYPPQNIWNSLKSVNILALCLVAMGYFTIMFILDTFSVTKVLKRFGHKESFVELLPARGMTYLIMVVNYAAAQLAFAFYQNRKHGVPISEMLGIFGIIVVIDLTILSTLASISSFFTSWPYDVAGMSISSFVRLFTAMIYAGLAVSILFWNGRLGKIGFLERLRTKDFFSVLCKAKISDYFSVALYRLPVHVFIMIGMYFAVKPFRADIPFVAIVSNIPIVFFIGSIPISPGGLGTTNAATVELFKPFITSPLITQGITTAGDLLFSFSLVWMFANYLMKGLTGLICLKFTSKDLFKPTEKMAEKTVIPDASQIAGDL